MSKKIAKITQLHIYPAENSTIDVPMVDAQMWLSVESMALLYGVDVKLIAEYVETVIRDDQLDTSVAKPILIPTNDGKKHYVKHYNRRVILPVGFRINSSEAARFREWAAKIIDDYVTKGIVVNESRLPDLDDATLDRVSAYSLKAIVAEYRARGDSEEKIQARLNGIVSRNDVTDAWKARIRGDFEYWELTNRTYTGLFRRTAKQLKRDNGGRAPRDGMTAPGLNLLSAAESAIAKMLHGREYVTIFEAMMILDSVCTQIKPAIEGLQTIMQIDLATSQSLLPDGNKSA